MVNTCRRAVEIGLPAVAFTEHVDFTDWARSRPPADVGARVGTRKRVLPGRRRRVPGQHREVPPRVPRAAHPVGHRGRRAAPLRGQRRRGAAVGRLRPRARLAALDRARRPAGLRQPRVPVAARRRGRARDYFAELLRLVEGSDVFEVLAHCDYPRRYWPAAPRGEYREADFEEEYRTVFRALASSGRPLELNTCSPLASVDPDALVVRGGRRRGVVRERRARARCGSGTSSTWPWTSSRRPGFRPGRDEYDFWRR